MSSANDKVTFLNRVFGTCVIGNDGLNVAVCCPNRNCGSYGSSAKKKLVIRADTDNYHCWVCDIKGKGIARVVGLVSPSKRAQYVKKFPQQNQKQENKRNMGIERMPNTFTSIRLVPPPCSAGFWLPGFLSRPGK